MLSFLRSLMGHSDLLPPADYLSRRGEGDVLLDVRTPVEYASGHLDGADNIDVMASDFAARVDALDRGKTYYLYCRSGNRSGQAMRRMKEMGFEDVHNIGGFDALSAAGAPVAP